MIVLAVESQTYILLNDPLLEHYQVYYLHHPYLNVVFSFYRDSNFHKYDAEHD